MASYRISEAAKGDLKRIYRRGVDSIFYRIVGNGVEIMRILGRQDIDEWL